MNGSLISVHTDMVSAFLTADRSTWSADTRRAYAQTAADYAKFIQTHGLGLVDGIGAYAEDLRHRRQRNGRRLSASTRARYLSAVKAHVQVVAERIDDPAIVGRIELALRRAKPPKRQQNVSHRKMVSAEESRTLILALRNNIVAGGKAVAHITAFLAETGCRISEALGVMLTDVSDEYREGERLVRSVRVTGKGDKERTVVVSADLFNAARAYFKGGTWLFEKTTGGQYNRGSVSNVIRRASAKVLGRTISAHCFRHGAITGWLSLGGKLEEVSAYAGHANVSTTMRYVHSQLGDNVIAAASAAMVPAA